MKRCFLTPKDIPPELWRDGTMYMPMDLVRVYEKLLVSNGIMDLAKSEERKKSVIGGESREDSLDHFARRYGVSVCRVECVVLDPGEVFGLISSSLQLVFSDGLITILDVPCGTGAAGVSLLSTVAVLRKNRLFPQLPLTVMITAGDISETALAIYEEIINKMRISLREVGIDVSFRGQKWDATESEQTSGLVDEWFKNSEGAEEYWCIIADFSGTGKKLPVERSFQHLHERLQSKKSSVLWVEPAELTDAKRFLKKVQDFLKPLRKFLYGSKTAHEYKCCWFHPFQRQKWPCRVLVQKFEKQE